MTFCDSPDKRTPAKRRNFPILFLLLMGPALSAGGYVVADGLTRASNQNRFANHADAIFDQIEKRISSSVEILHSITGFFVASGEVDRGEFNSFVRSLGELHSVQALEWIPRAPLAERPIYENTARRDGYPGFSFTERRADGTMAPAGERPEYYPVYCVEPYAGNESAFGFDLGSDATRLAALQQARDSGELAATARIILVQETGEQYGFLFFGPVYRKGADVTTVAARRTNLSGFGVGVFRMGDLVHDIHGSPASTPWFAMEIMDKSAPAGSQKLYPKSDPPDPPHASSFRATRGLTVGGRHWMIAVTSLPAFNSASPFAWQAWVVFLTGLTFTLVTTLYLYQAQNRAKAVERLVEERTTQLRSSEARAHAVIDNAADAIITINAMGVIETFNPAAERIFGYPAEECTGRNVTMLIPDHDRSAHDSCLAKYPKTEMSQTVGSIRETVGRRKNGEDFPISFSLGEFRVNGIPMFAGICRDITARKRAQEEIAAVNKELECFAYSVSHDLRAPLRGIDGFSQALIEEFGGKLDGDARKYIGRIRAGTQYMGRLIDDMLNLSRVTRREMRRQTVDLSALANRIVARLREVDPDRDVAFVTPTGLNVQGDERLLWVLLENLIRNAWKFTTRTDRARIELGATLGNNETVIRLRDNGAGFDMAYADKLFIPFQRLHSSNEFEGAGIGLATSARIVRRHGGRIWAQGSPGNGATIYFTLSGN